MIIERSKLKKDSVTLIEEDISFNKEDYKDVSMLKDIKSCHVECDINDYGSIIEVSLRFEADLILECSYTLEDVDYTLKGDDILEFSDELEDEDIMPFSGDKIDLDPYILSLIVAHLPLRVRKKGAKPIKVEDVYVVSEDELEEERKKSPDPRLKALDEWNDED